MVRFHPEYVIDKDKNPKSVLLPVAEWEQVVADLEELEDIREFDRAKSSQQETIPFEQAVHEI